jgi:hypothetical protein
MLLKRVLVAANTTVKRRKNDTDFCSGREQDQTIFRPEKCEHSGPCEIE